MAPRYRTRKYWPSCLYKMLNDDVGTTRREKSRWRYRSSFVRTYCRLLLFIYLRPEEVVRDNNREVQYFEAERRAALEN